jgi:ADP-ribose pyrophosphatase YjhB (NUDIX family)
VIKEHIETDWNRKYPHPSVAADIVALGLRTFDSAYWRAQEEMKVSLVLVRRGRGSQIGKWALPGGFFLTKDRDFEACARRELQEEAGLDVRALIPIGTFSGVGRDDRGWVMSIPYLAIINKADMAVSRPRGGDDASEAQWFDVNWSRDERSHRMSIILDACNHEKFSFVATWEGEVFGQPKMNVTYSSTSAKLAFDHAEIIATALYNLGLPGKRMRSFAFLGSEFTIAELRYVYSFMLGIPSNLINRFSKNEPIECDVETKQLLKKLIPQNFRRDIIKYLEPTGRMSEGKGHRPAAKYRWTQVSPE